MHKRLKNLIGWLVEIKHYLFRHHLNISFSQEGEDLLLNRIFSNQEKGFYVDIGAHHPFRYSNTCYFYKKGWSGINIDPLPGSMKKFDIFRSRDLNIELPVSNSKEELTYYILNDSALNGFSKLLTEERIAKGNYHLVDIKKFKSRTLKEIFDIYIKKTPLIDFMSIDVEGHEYEVVISNDWSIYRPKIVLVEILNKTLDELITDKTARFLEQCGYHFFAKTLGTSFFATEEYFKERFGRNGMKT